MEYNILINKDTLQRAVDTRNHYMGEALKRHDVNADIIQSSCDDNALFDIFLATACNELTSSVALRFSNIACTVTKDFVEITLECTNKDCSTLIPLLKQSITDYLVNELALQWLLLRHPDMAQSYISLRTSLYNNVQQQFAKIYRGQKRRRATDLAGI